MGIWQTIGKLTFLIGSLGFGFIMGYWTNKTVKMAEEFSARELGLIVSMILGAAVTQIVGKNEAVIGLYLIGAFIGVMWHYKEAIGLSRNKGNSPNSRAGDNEQGKENIISAASDHHAEIEKMVAPDRYAPAPVGEAGTLDGEVSDSDDHSPLTISDHDKDLIRQMFSPIITPSTASKESVANDIKADSDKNPHNDMAMANSKNGNQYPC